MRVRIQRPGGCLSLPLDRLVRRSNGTLLRRYAGEAAIKSALQKAAADLAFEIDHGAVPDILVVELHTDGRGFPSAGVPVPPGYRWVMATRRACGEAANLIANHIWG